MNYATHYQDYFTDTTFHLQEEIGRQHYGLMSSRREEYTKGTGRVEMISCVWLEETCQMVSDMDTYTSLCMCLDTISHD